MTRELYCTDMVRGYLLGVWWWFLTIEAASLFPFFEPVSYDGIEKCNTVGRECRERMREEGRCVVCTRHPLIVN